MVVEEGVATGFDVVASDNPVEGLHEIAEDPDPASCTDAPLQSVVSGPAFIFPSCLRTFMVTESVIMVSVEKERSSSAKSFPPNAEVLVLIKVISAEVEFPE